MESGNEVNIAKADPENHSNPISHASFRRNWVAPMVGLLILSLVITMAMFLSRQSGSPRLVVKKSPTETPTQTEAKLDDFITYSIPDRWKKTWYPKSSKNEEYIHLTSPDYRRNSASGVDQGASIYLSKTRINSNKTLQEILEKEHLAINLEARTIDNLQAFKSQPKFEYSPNEFRVNTIKDNYLWNFNINYLNDQATKQYSSTINTFLDSIKFINHNQTIDTADWKTYENKDIQFSFQYPSDWTLTDEKDGNDIVGVTVKGSQGELTALWGTGFGGGCYPTGYEKIQTKEETLNTCHRVRDDGSEAWEQIGKQLSKTSFQARAYAYAPIENNRNTILKIISTFKFTQ